MPRDSSEYGEVSLGEFHQGLEVPRKAAHHRDTFRGFRVIIIRNFLAFFISIRPPAVDRHVESNEIA